MATTIDLAEKKLAAKIPSMPANYKRGMATFFGRDVAGSPPARSYEIKVSPGMERRWRENLERAFGV